VSPFARLVRRDLARDFAHGGAWLPLVFYLLVATLFPFAIGPDAVLLAKVGSGALWTAALLAALLPVERLVRPDIASGVLDQLAVRGHSDEGIAAAKLMAHWLSFGPLLMIATVPAAALLNLDGVVLERLEIGLLLGDYPCGADQGMPAGAERVERHAFPVGGGEWQLPTYLRWARFIQSSAPRHRRGSAAV